MWNETSHGSEQLCHIVVLLVNSSLDPLIVTSFWRLEFDLGIIRVSFVMRID